MSSVLSYLSFNIFSHFNATCHQIESAMAVDLHWVMVSIAVAIIAACLIFAGLILARKKPAANTPPDDKISSRETESIKVDSKTAIPQETSGSVGALAPENTAEDGVPLAPAQIAGAKGITAAEDVVLTRLRIQVEELSQEKQLTEQLRGKHRQVTVPVYISELEITPAQAIPNEIVTISCKLTNMNDIPVYCVVTLKINGMVIATKGASLVRRSAEHINFSVVATLPGDYQIEVNGLTGRLTILGEMQQTFVCPRCGSRNDAGYQFCGDCGIRLAAG